MQWLLENEAYLGRVHWRGESYPGLHEAIIDEPTFQAAQALLRERGEDLTLRRGNRSDFLLSGVIHCGRCKRAYVGMSAKGNGGSYFYYACSGRQKLGRKGCDSERLNRDKLEAAVLTQLARLYRDGDLLADALQRAYDGQVRTGRHSKNSAARSQTRFAAVSARSTATHQAFETGALEPAQFKRPLAEIEDKLDTLRTEDHALAGQLADPATSLDPQALATVADRLRDTLAAGEPERTRRSCVC